MKDIFSNLNLGKCSNMPTCGGIGTYLPNYHTMQVSGQGENDRKNDIFTLFSDIPSTATSFMNPITNLTEFIQQEFEPG